MASNARWGGMLLAAGMLCAASAAQAIDLPACTDPDAPAWYLGDVDSLDPSDEAGMVDPVAWGYAGALRGSKEPSFRCGTPPAEAYRFVWEPPFLPGIAVRAQRDAAGRMWMASRSLPEVSGPGYPKKPAWPCAADRELTATEWASVVDAFDGLQPDVPARFGLDGEGWYFESLRQGRQHWVHRWQPRAPSLLQAGRTMLRLAGCDAPLALVGTFVQGTAQ